MEKFKKFYIVPQTSLLHLNAERLLTRASEPEWSGFIGAKENDNFEEVEENSDLGLAPTNPNIWGDDEEE